MNCAGCEATLLRREHAQPMRVLGRWIHPPSLCDDCCRHNLGRAGSPEALSRLIAGKSDPDELARIVAATADWPNPMTRALLAERAGA